MLTVGQQSPDFELVGDDGKLHTLSTHVNRWVILYFYPKDNTPGCTIEACDFRDHMDLLHNYKVIVYGISKDSTKSHLNFKNKHALNFTLLSDETLQVHNAYGALTDEKKTIRSTFLIDPKGVIAYVWPKVQIKEHVKDICSILRDKIAIS